MIQIDMPMPKSCTECPCNNDFINCGVTGRNFYKDGNAEALDKRPDNCPLKEELSNKEKDYLYGILCKQDWTEQAICDGIINKLKLLKHN